MRNRLYVLVLAITGCSTLSEPIPPSAESGIPAWIVPLAREGPYSDAHPLDGLLDVSIVGGRPQLVPRKEEEELRLRRADSRLVHGDGLGPLEMEIVWATSSWRGVRRSTIGRSMLASSDDWVNLLPIRAWRSDLAEPTTRSFRRWLYVRDHDRTRIDVMRPADSGGASLLLIALS